MTTQRTLRPVTRQQVPRVVRAYASAPKPVSTLKCGHRTSLMERRPIDRFLVYDVATTMQHEVRLPTSSPQCGQMRDAVDPRRSRQSVSDGSRHSSLVIILTNQQLGVELPEALADGHLPGGCS